MPSSFNRSTIDVRQLSFSELLCAIWLRTCSTSTGCAAAADGGAADCEAPFMEPARPCWAGAWDCVAVPPAECWEGCACWGCWFAATAGWLEGKILLRMVPNRLMEVVPGELRSSSDCGQR